MIKPLLCVVTVTLNNLDGLKKTHNSLRHIQNYEWIVIDGNSTDDTTIFLDTTNATYISETDNGIYDAMNKGLALATGVYVIFMNAGDVFSGPKFLEKIDKDTYDFIYGDAQEMLGNNIIYKTARPHNKITHGMITHHQAMIYNRKALGPRLYNTNYKIASDYDFTWQTLDTAQNILYIPQPICLFESGGLSQQQVLLGRIEQFKIRHTHKISFFKNLFIFTAQTILYAIRKISPRTYWFLKNR